MTINDFIAYERLIKISEYNPTVYMGLEGLRRGVYHSPIDCLLQIQEYLLKEIEDRLENINKIQEFDFPMEEFKDFLKTYPKEDEYLSDRQRYENKGSIAVEVERIVVIEKARKQIASVQIEMSKQPPPPIIFMERVSNENALPKSP